MEVESREALHVHGIEKVQGRQVGAVVFHKEIETHKW